MITVHPGTASGAVRVPASKSHTHRAMILSALAGGGDLLDPSTCDDARATLDCLTTLGVRVEPRPGRLRLSGDLGPTRRTLHARESGSTLRFLVPLVALLSRTVRIRAGFSLQRRPVRPLAAALRQLGARVEVNEADDALLIRGPIQGGTASIDVSGSSQFLSGLLMALPSAAHDSTVVAHGVPVSAPYLKLTLRECVASGLRIRSRRNEFKVHGRQRPIRRRHAIPGDASSAAFLAAAAAVSGGDVTIANGFDPAQADALVPRALEAFGAKVRRSGSNLRVRSEELIAADVDVRHAPDAFPVLCAVAALAEGTSTIRGAAHLRAKESDRVEAMAENLERAGIEVGRLADGLRIRGGAPRGFTVDDHRDHRVAMACSVLALGASAPVTLRDPSVVAKSYPGFFHDLSQLGAKVVTL